MRRAVASLGIRRSAHDAALWDDMSCVLGRCGRRNRPWGRRSRPCGRRSRPRVGGSAHEAGGAVHGVGGPRMSHACEAVAPRILKLWTSLEIRPRRQLDARTPDVSLEPRVANPVEHHFVASAAWGRLTSRPGKGSREPAGLVRATATCIGRAVTCRVHSTASTNLSPHEPYQSRPAREEGGRSGNGAGAVRRAFSTRWKRASQRRCPQVECVSRMAAHQRMRTAHCVYNVHAAGAMFV